ncbi:MAG: hypothetical protein VW378_05295 [bacterium]
MDVTYFDNTIDEFIKRFSSLFNTKFGYFGGWGGAGVSGYFGKDGDKHITLSPLEFKKRINRFKEILFKNKSEISRKEFF